MGFAKTRTTIPDNSHLELLDKHGHSLTNVKFRNGTAFVRSTGVNIRFPVEGDTLRKKMIDGLMKHLSWETGKLIITNKYGETATYLLHKGDKKFYLDHVN